MAFVRFLEGKEQIGRSNAVAMCPTARGKSICVQAGYMDWTTKFEKCYNKNN